MVEGMLFLLLQEMSGSTLLCGLSVVVTVLFELPIFRYAKVILERMGTRNMILLGQFAWVVRAVFYAFMNNPWLVLLIEPLHGVTFAFVWTAATQHVADPLVSGVGLEASAQSLLQVCFMGLGPMCGLFVGGLLFDSIGSHAAYGVFAAAVLAAGLVYVVCGKGEAESRGNTTKPGESQPVPLKVGRSFSLSPDADIIAEAGDAGEIAFDDSNCLNGIHITDSEIISDDTKMMG